MSKERTNLKNLAWKYFSKYIRIRDCLETTQTKEYGRCCTCGQIKEFKMLDAGHFVPGRKDAYLFEEKNCHAQCSACNRFKQGMWVEYLAFMENKYGAEITNKIIRLKFFNKKLSTLELKEIKDYYKNKVKEIEQA